MASIRENKKGSKLVSFRFIACIAYERKAFLDGLQYGAELMLELQSGQPKQHEHVGGD